MYIIYVNLNKEKRKLKLKKKKKKKKKSLLTYAFLWEKVKTVDFSETIAACDLKVGRCRQLIEIMKLCEY